LALPRVPHFVTNTIDSGRDGTGGHEASGSGGEDEEGGRNEGGEEGGEDAANTSSENPINPKIKILAKTGTENFSQPNESHNIIS
jgi:hypothetical protein